MRTSHKVLGAVVAAAVALAGLAGCSSSSSAGSGGKLSGSLTVLFGTSGQAETKALQDAATAWTKQSGVKVNVRPATDFQQELAQGFASGKPADVFYVSPDQFPSLVNARDLYPYASKLPNANDFYPSLRETFSKNGTFYAAPKDVGALALAINTDLWTKAGLTDADIPKTWDQLASDAAKLSATGVAGISISPDFAHVGPFLLENGGWLVNKDQTKATADSKQNAEALDYIKKLLSSGSMKLTTQLGVGWSGEALGKQKAAMVIEGPWLKGAMSSDYPNVKYKVVELPAGPAGKGTMFFTNAWGIAAQSKNKDAAVDFVKFLTTSKQQMTFARAFGPIPALSSAAGDYTKAFPEGTAYLTGIKDAKTYPTLVGFGDVMNDMNAKLSQIQTTDSATLLQSVQKNLSAIIK